MKLKTLLSQVLIVAAFFTTAKLSAASSRYNVEGVLLEFATIGFKPTYIPTLRIKDTQTEIVHDVELISVEDGRAKIKWVDNETTDIDLPSDRKDQITKFYNEVKEVKEWNSATAIKMMSSIRKPNDLTYIID